ALRAAPASTPASIVAPSRPQPPVAVVRPQAPSATEPLPATEPAPVAGSGSDKSGGEAGTSGAAGAADSPATRSFDGNWPALVAEVKAVGLVAQFLQQSALVEHDGLSFRLRVPIRPLAEPGTVNRARAVLSGHFGAEVRLSVEVGAVDGPTAAAIPS